MLNRETFLTVTSELLEYRPVQGKPQRLGVIRLGVGVGQRRGAGPEKPKQCAFMGQDYPPRGRQGSAHQSAPGPRPPSGARRLWNLGLGPPPSQAAPRPLTLEVPSQDR